MKNKITFTFKEKEDFKLKVVRAVTSKAATFTYKGIEIPTNYGHFLADYLEIALPFPEYTGLTQPVTIDF